MSYRIDAGEVTAYAIAVKHGYEGTEEEWLASLNGEDGKSAYAIAVEHGYEGTEEEWLASLNGKDGKSAYTIAVEHGYEGTEEEWIASLHGEDGKSAYEIAVDHGYEGTETEWLTSLHDHRTAANRSAADQHPISAITGLAELIPVAASAANKLVDAQQMGDAIMAVEAKQLYATAQQGSFATKAALLAAPVFYDAAGAVAVPTKNDVAYILADESHDGKSAKYVIASADPLVWGFVIAFSSSTFTQAQLDALNSGATAARVETWDAKQGAIDDLETIRDGAAAGATALQTVPSTYRTAAAQDEIDAAQNAKLNNTEALEFTLDDDSTVTLNVVVKAVGA